MIKNLRRRLHAVSRTLTVLVLAAGLLFAVAELRRGKLPTQSDISKELLSAPRQSATGKAPFNFEYMGYRYTVVPHAQYHICGLLVSHNNIRSIFDAYHKKDSIDIRDMCVIWGGNLTEMDYHQAKFWSETWSCHIRIDDQDTWENFRGAELSNNHLVPATASVQSAILKARVGDQICFDGRLVDYAPYERPEAIRKTSLRRDDDGNGACEVVLVDRFSILKTGTPTWNSLADMGWLMFVWLVPLRVLVFLIFPVIEYRWG